MVNLIKNTAKQNNLKISPKCAVVMMNDRSSKAGVKSSNLHFGILRVHFFYERQVFLCICFVAF